MKSIGAFFRLIRPLNLLIIVLTMYAMRWLIIHPLLNRAVEGADFPTDDFHFAIAVLIIVLLGAAGNIINDYFDVKVDRINKPRKVVVGYTIKRRVAMAAHHVLNALATVLALYLGWRFRQWELSIIPIVMGAMLWFYSLTFKKQFIIGNLTVAILVAIVPLWAGLVEIPTIQAELATLGRETLSTGQQVTTVMWKFLIGYAAFAFALTFIREIQKDMEDLAGDREQGFRTMPIVLGIKKTKAITAGLLILTLIVAINLQVYVFKPVIDIEEQLLYHGPFTVLIALPLLFGFFTTTRAKDRPAFHRASKLSKIAMAGGIAFALFFRFAILTHILP
ncbi:geranylgeranylglycerol-phosphate geranylgeranyltransferase [Halocola ammonii]